MNPEQAAIEALNSLDKKSITELKAMASPPPGVDDVTAGVMVTPNPDIFLSIKSGLG